MVELGRGDKGFSYVLREEVTDKTHQQVDGDRP